MIFEIQPCRAGGRGGFDGWGVNPSRKNEAWLEGEGHVLRGLLWGCWFQGRRCDQAALSKYQMAKEKLLLLEVFCVFNFFFQCRYAIFWKGSPFK